MSPYDEDTVEDTSASGRHLTGAYRTFGDLWSRDDAAEMEREATAWIEEAT